MDFWGPKLLYCWNLQCYTKRMVIFTFFTCIIAKKCAKLRSNFACLKMHHTHAHHKFKPKWVRIARAHCNLWPHIPTCDLISHVMHWSLVSTSWKLAWKIECDIRADFAHIVLTCLLIVGKTWFQEIKSHS